MKCTVDIEAERVYEAAVLALQALREAHFLETPAGLASRFKVSVMQPTVPHEVTLLQVRNWVNRTSGHPADAVRRKRLRQVLEACLPASALRQRAVHLTKDLTK